jgi:hypothetical protein
MPRDHEFLSRATPLEPEPASQCVDGGVPVTNSGIESVVDEDFAVSVLCGQSW